MVGVEAKIDVASLTTENSKRDGHLKSPDFFDAAQFPNILFKNRTVNKLGTDEYEVIGDLTIKGITKTITLRGKNSGFIDAGMMGGETCRLFRNSDDQPQGFWVELESETGSGRFAGGQ